MYMATGKVTNYAEGMLNDYDYREALEKHRQGLSGVDHSLGTLWHNQPLFGKPSGHRSTHRDRFGTTFEIITDFGGTTRETTVTLKN